MDLLTIYNYSDQGNHLNLLKLWLARVQIHNNENLDVYVLSYMQEPEHIKTLHKKHNFVWKILPIRQDIGDPFLDKKYIMQCSDYLKEHSKSDIFTIAKFKQNLLSI